MSDTQPGKQLLHLVFGGELDSVSKTEFKDLDKLDIVGVYPNYATRLRGVEGQGARHRRQCADAIFHRAYASPARRARGTEGLEHDPEK